MFCVKTKILYVIQSLSQWLPLSDQKFNYRSFLGLPYSARDGFHIAVFIYQCSTPFLRSRSCPLWIFIRQGHSAKVLVEIAITASVAWLG